MRCIHGFAVVGVVLAWALPGLHPWAVGAPASPAATRPAGQTKASLTALFAPGDDCIKPVVEELNAATKSIRLQGWVLASDPIGTALARARQRGVDVWVILDNQEASERPQAARDLLTHRIVVRVSGFHTPPYTKIILVDGSVVIAGSFCFATKAETQNAEHVLIIKGDPDLARRFQQNWATQAKHSSACPSGAEPAADESASKGSTAAMTATAKKAAGKPAPKAAPAADKSKDADKDRDKSQQTVYVTGSGKRYHRKDCQFARTGTSAVTREEAIRQGKTPCRVCNPDE